MKLFLHTQSDGQLVGYSQISQTPSRLSESSWPRLGHRTEKSKTQFAFPPSLLYSLISRWKT